MKYLVIVTADTNDADYVQHSEVIDMSKPDGVEYLENVKKVSKMLTETAGKFETNWPAHESSDIGVFEQYSEYLSEDDLDTFHHTFVPSSEYGVHSIKEIQVMQVSNIKQLFYK